MTYPNKNDDNKELSRAAWIVIILVAIAFIILFIRTNPYLLFI
jgi:hypothetical protein